MQFTVKYRKTGGVVDEIVIDAESRSAVFQELKKRGITAISVTEGAPKGRRAAASSRGGAANGRTFTRGIVAGLIVVIGAVCAWLYFAPATTSPDKPSQPKAEKKPKAAQAPAKPRETAKPAPDTKPATTNKVATPAKPKVDPKERLDLVATTNAHGEVMERWRTADGKTHARLIPPKPIFDNPVDQALSIALSAPEGVALPPMPSLGPGADKEFADALMRPIVINDDDSESIKRAKILVQAGRTAMLEELKNGKSVNEVIQDHCRAVNDSVELRNEAARAYRELIDSGETEMAEKYREQANKIIEQSGGAPLPQHGTGNRRREKGTDK